MFLNPKFLDHEPLYEPTLKYKSHSSQLHTHHAKVCAPIVGTSKSTCNFGCWIDSEIASSDWTIVNHEERYFNFSKLGMRMLWEEKWSLSYLHMFVETYIISNLGSIVKTTGKDLLTFSKDKEPHLWPLLTFHPNPNYEALDDNLRDSWLLTLWEQSWYDPIVKGLFVNLEVPTIGPHKVCYDGIRVHVNKVECNTI